MAGGKGFQLAESPQPLPEVAALTLTGEAVALKTALSPGTPALVNLWAIWCPPCVRELPALAKLQAALGREATVVALSVDRGGPAAVGAYVDKTGLSGLTILSDPRSESLQILKSRGLPTTLLLDRQHREVARLEGDGDWERPETVAAVRALLGLVPAQAAESLAVK